MITPDINKTVERIQREIAMSDLQNVGSKRLAIEPGYVTSFDTAINSLRDEAKECGRTNRIARESMLTAIANELIELQALRSTQAETVGALPCPFCGGSLWIGGVEKLEEDEWVASGYRAWCASCKMSMSEQPTREEARAAWNAQHAIHAFWAVHSATGMHIGLWPKREDADQVAREYEGCTVTPLFPHPRKTTVIPDDVRSFLFAILGADTWVEAGAIWDQNPDHRKAAHSFLSPLEGDSHE